MRGPEFLQQFVGRLKSNMGGVVPGSHAAIRGCDIHSTFKDAEWMDFYMFAITGRRFSQRELALLQSIWVYTSYPDARIWNNRVAALAGSARCTPILAGSAALAISEAQIYGGGTYMPAIAFLQRTRQRMLSGDSIGSCIDDELREYRRIAGYGRPVASADERITPILSRANELGLDQGPHLALALEVDKLLQERRLRMRMNYAAAAAALAADIGLSPDQFYLAEYPVFLAGMLPCYLEGLDRPEGATFPIPCDDVEYDGCNRRSWKNRQLAVPLDRLSNAEHATMPSGEQL